VLFQYVTKRVDKSGTSPIGHSSPGVVFECSPGTPDGGIDIIVCGIHGIGDNLSRARRTYWKYLPLPNWLFPSVDKKTVHGFRDGARLCDLRNLVRHFVYSLKLVTQFHHMYRVYQDAMPRLCIDHFRIFSISVTPGITPFGRITMSPRLHGSHSQDAHLLMQAGCHSYLFEKTSK
jgi:hypothetical protein